MKSYIKRDVKAITVIAQQKLAQHCKAIILQLKIFKNDIPIKCKVRTLLKSQFKKTNYQKPVEHRFRYTLVD